MIGALSRRVTLERPDRTPDAGGGASTVWTPVATVWARVSSEPRRDREVADDLAARVEHTVVVRWRSDVEPGWRVLSGGRTLRVQALADRDQAKRWLHLQCEEEAP